MNNTIKFVRCLTPASIQIPQKHCWQTTCYRFLNMGKFTRKNKSRSFRNMAVVSGIMGSTIMCCATYEWFQKCSARTHSVLPEVCALEESSISNHAKRFNFIADVVEKVSPTVVFISVVSLANHPFFGGVQQSSTGSGFIIRDDGLILTNAHVVQNATTVQVKLQNGKVFEGQVQAIDSVTDLATVKIDCNNLPSLKLGSSSALRPGEWAIAMGSPFNLSNTVTAGIVSSVHRPSSELGIHNRHIDYIQTDATINIGNSGGPLINLDGEAIGINTMKVTAGISLAIPSDIAKEFVTKAEKYDKITKKRGKSPATRQHYLGVVMMTLSPSMIYQLGDKIQKDISSGVLITQVQHGSPAQKAGLAQGDVIVMINGKEVKSTWDIMDAVQESDTVTLKVWRGNSLINVSCVLSV